MSRSQSWWKKNNRTTTNTRATAAAGKRNVTRTFKSGRLSTNDETTTAGHSTDTSNETLKSATAQTDSTIRVPPSENGSSTAPANSSTNIRAGTPKRRPTLHTDVNILTTEPTNLSERQIRLLQEQLGNTMRLKQQLERELNLRASQVEQMEDNLRLVADQSKMIGVRAMEQEQKLLEVKKALELKTKQLALYRQSKADQIPLNAITVLPMHLRGKFSEFLRRVLMQQKRFFETALNAFVVKEITDKELSFQSSGGNALSRESLLSEIGKIGNSLAYDYMSELELRLNGTFSNAQDTRYKLNDDKKVNGVNGAIPSNSRAGSRLGDPRGPMMTTHTPMGSFGSTASVGGSMGTHSAAHSTQVSTDSTKQKAKTGGFLVNVKKSFARKRAHNDSQNVAVPEPQSQASSPMPQGSAPPRHSPQPHYPAYSSSSNHNQFVPHQYPQMAPVSQHDTLSRAQQVYSFPRSRTSVQKSDSNVADIGQLMQEIADREDYDSQAENDNMSEKDDHSPRGSVVIKSGSEADFGEGMFEDGHSPRKSSAVRFVNPLGDDSENLTLGSPLVGAVPPPPQSPISGDDSDDADDDEEDQFDGDTDAMAMQQHLMSMTKKHTEAILATHGPDGSNELNKMWSQFVQFKKEMDRPSDAPLAYTVPDKTTPFVELRDMLEALPFDLSCAILREQQMNPYDRIKDVTLQRGCWPQVRFVNGNRVSTVNKVFIQFDDVLRRLEMYLQNEKDSTQPQLSAAHLEMMNGGASPKSANSKPKPLKPAGLQLLGALDPQKTTGFRLHQITSVIRQRNEASHTITALNLRVGRLWNMDASMEENLISDSIDFFQSLDTPSTMLLLGPNTSEKCALCREIARQLSSSPINMRTALVDTRSTVGGFTKSPIETGQSIRFFVNSIDNQKNQIDATRSIYPQVVVVDEVLSSDDITSIGKLQSEGISVVVGTNMHSLEALLGHPTYSQLLPPQNRLISHEYPAMNTLSGATHSRRSSYQYSAMSPHLLILEISADGLEVKMYKNIPAAVKAIKRFSQPEYKSYKLKWQGYNPTDASAASKFVNDQSHRRTTSRMVNKLMKETMSYHSLPRLGMSPGAPSMSLSHH